MMRRLCSITFRIALVLIAALLTGSQAAAAPVCTIDVQGANDEPGQKDLTLFCSDTDADPFDLLTEWNWDSTDFGNPGGNTGDGCTLYDTADVDGFANFAVCVTVDGDPAEDVAVRLFSCSNTRADRCAGAAELPGPFDTACAAASSADDPFPAGESNPNDTKAECQIEFDDFGVASLTLLNACSYPSNEPNSDPSDCVDFVECNDNAQCGDGNECTTDICNDNGDCENNINEGASCGDPSSGLCDGADICDSEGICQPNTTPNGTVCGAGDQCTNPDTCSAGVCVDGGFKGAGTACGSASDTVCSDPDTCNGAGVCQPNHAGTGVVCREAAAVCDVNETCDGAGNCPTDGFQPAETLCRAGSGDLCDPDEVCTGSSASCPTDVVSSSSTVCNAGSGDLCDLDELCTGVAGQACPTDTVAPSTTVCNAGSGDACDPDELCTGVADQACPADTVTPVGTVCNPGSGDLCDPDEVCSGNAGEACPNDDFEPNTTVCRTGGDGTCDPDEMCPGAADQTCPADGFATEGTTCGDASDGVCDNPDTCDGLGACLPRHEDTTTQCNPSTGVCDPAEFCDGEGSCDPDALSPAGTVCREEAGDCDVAEECNGIDVTCPVDGFEPPGTSCGDDTDNACTDPDTCDALGFCLPNNEPCGALTDSALCLFDTSTKGVCVDTNFDPTGNACDTTGALQCPTGETCVEENQFRLLFTPAADALPGFKLNASNPGQFFYNLVSESPGCDPGVTEETFEIVIPFPFVTQGAQAVHVYDGELVGNADGVDCFAPPAEALASYGLSITTDDYWDGSSDGAENLFLNCNPNVNGIDQIGQKFCTFQVTAAYPASCQLYINVHLDYGLKGKDTDANPRDGSADRYDRGAVASFWNTYDALKHSDANIALSDCRDHPFSHEEVGTMVTFSDNAQNLNDFAKVPPGVFGRVFSSNSGDGEVGLTVKLLDQNDVEVASAVTDENGFYFIAYKHKGKQAPYEIEVEGYEATHGQIQLKGGSAIIEANLDVFPVPPVWSYD